MDNSITIQTKQRLTMILLSCLEWGCSPISTSELRKSIQELLKVKYPFDHWRIRSCIDLIEDTEYAIISFSKYGLKKFSKKDHYDFEEMYLRLYGVLNAIQQQKLAIIELCDTIKPTMKNEILRKINDLKIIEIRHVVGSHTINLNKKKEEQLPSNFKSYFFRISQSTINSKADDIDVVDGFENVRNYNIYECVIEFNQVFEMLFYKLVQEYMNEIFEDDQERMENLFKHYELEELIPFDYKKLYKNGKLSSRYYNKLQKKIEKEYEREFGKDWKKSINENLSDLAQDELINIQIEYLRSKIQS